ncbi:hypothetical protein [Glycomyces terrestris]|uniref:Uncharacterized protein n=1 Tax=Glycomyces terrestris TaxID=2493553 RepID=A0A426UZZ8_9ACTN|nr:hypothetical protein [Glycomyces terrestris]RRS00155.1 hypothetical protein EIW28_06055 [Glycomyces terrestris]
MGTPTERRPLTVRLLMGLLVLSWIDFMAVLIPEYFACGPHDLGCRRMGYTSPVFLTVLVVGASLLLLYAFAIWHRRAWAWFLAVVTTGVPAMVLLAEFDAWLAAPPLEKLAGVLDLTCLGLLVSPPVWRWARVRPAEAGE